MKKFLKFFLERSNVSKGCAMLYFNLPQMQEIHDMIDDEDIYIEDDDYGLEDETHCTLLYGFDPDVKGYDVLGELEDFKVPPLILANASLFENEKYDVLKFDVKDDSKTIQDMNERLMDNFPYESDYPDYHPHVTIGYLVKGMGKKYVEKMKGLEYEVIPNEIVYSSPDEIKTRLQLNDE